MEILGLIGLLVFFGVIIASLRGWIPQHILPVQSALILSSFGLAIIALVFGKPFSLVDVTANIFLHPITALIAGFLVAGALEAAGAFKAAIKILERLAKTPLGLSGTVVVLVNMPTIFAMPCGRILAAALMPAALLFSYEMAKISKDPVVMSMIIFGFIVNAAASCGPSLLGGIGTIGEGMGGYPIGSFSNVQQISIMLITAVCMLTIKYVFRIIPNESIVMSALKTDRKPEGSVENVPKEGYFAFFSFLITIALVVIFKPHIPIQTILIGFVAIIMFISKVSIKDLIAGVILHPIMAMLSGFIIAGSLVAIGSFDTLMEILLFLAKNTPLGFVGVVVILANLPTILPMPCGRIIAMALLPGVLLFGLKISEVTGYEWVTPIILISFILNAAASCGPSPLGGIGGIGEGNLGTAIGASGKPQQVAIMIGTGVAALLVSIFHFL